MERTTLGVLAALVAACGGDMRDSAFGDGVSDSLNDSAATDDGGPAGTDGDGGNGSGSGAQDGSDDGPDPGSDDDALKLDVGSGMDGPTNCAGDETCDEGCTAIDLLFVIDNSGSMGDYQAALGLAFPAFAQTLSDTLPPGTNVHVGVTSTEMAYSSQGTTSINNGSCEFIGDGDQSNDAFYVPPTESDSGRNGAQGRLYDPGGGETFVSFETGAADLSAVQDWFSAAVNIGEGGSNIEMATGPVAWVADAANAATNEGFIRDEGAVLVVFFLQDEPDQTPATVDGQSTGAFALSQLAAAKAGCGGTDCIIAGGFLEANACSADGDLPLDEFLAGVGASPVVSSLPNQGADPATSAAQMNETLSTTLADIIATTCESIPPAG